MTINDIAKLAGVSKSTVSRVLNHAANVDETTRELVLRIVRQHNYLPSATARSLSRKGTTVIGVILPDIDDSFFGKIAQGINDILSDTDYTMLFCCTDNDPKRELKALNSLCEQRVCGLLITSSAHYCSEKEAALIREAIINIPNPAVLIDRILPHSLWDGVYSDNLNGAYTAANALISHGCRRIGAFISDITLQLGKDRLSGFKQALTDSGLTPADEYMFLQNTPAAMTDVYHYTCRLIQKKLLPEAIFLSNSIITNGFYKAILEHNIRPGKHIHCVGFDYSDALDIIHVPYSYVERNSRLMGQTAAKMLLRQFQQPSQVRHENVIPSTLHIDPTLQR
jgi:LacI family transcriptional regulator